MKGRWARHVAMRDRTVEWLAGIEETGFAPLAGDGHRSPTVTCVSVPGGEGARPIVAEMRSRGWVIGGGYGKLADATLRIGHMGDHTLDELNELLDVLGDVLT